MYRFLKKALGVFIWLGLVTIPLVSFSDEQNPALVIQQAINESNLEKAEELLSKSDISEFQQGYLAGWLSLKQGKKDAAIATWTELHQTYPTSLELGNNLAVLLIDEGRYDEAKNLLETTLNSDKQVSKALENLRELYGYKAQQAYKKVFSKLDVTKPKGHFLELTSKSDIQLVTNDFEEFSEIAKAVETWRKAWSAKDIAAYLNSYGKDFVPADGQALDSWKSARNRSLTAPRYIEIKLEQLEVAPLNETHVRVSFKQSYKSDRFQDEIYKVLLFKKYSDDWKIIQEALVYESN